MKLSALFFSLLTFGATVMAQNAPVELNSGISAPSTVLDVSISIFVQDQTLDETIAKNSEAETEKVISTEEISQAETRYMPMLLRYRLEAGGLFGAVRVVPVVDSGAELSIEGRIVHSDEHSLSLALKATDSRGDVWIDKLYTGNAISSESLNNNSQTNDDFYSVYSSFLSDLSSKLNTFDEASLGNIRDTALLRYGLELVPQHFAEYLEQDAEGAVHLLRLPAVNDPILTRIESIRDREYLFIDVVDEEYSRFYNDIKPVYDMWRATRREQIQGLDAFTTRQQTQEQQFARGTYYDLQDRYNNYRWAKLQELYLEELKTGFANETETTEITLSDSLYRLTGTMEQQYREWRRILAEYYVLETEGG